MSRCEQTGQVSSFALQAMPAGEAAAMQAHIASCPHCRQELDTLRPVVDRFVA